MTLMRTGLSLVLALALAPVAKAQSYALKETPQPDTFFEVRLKLALDGEIKVRQDDKTLTFKQSVTATHDFVERVLETGQQNTLQKVARFYRQAKVGILVGDQKSERTLRPERCFVVTQRVGEGLLTYSPKGPLTREELEVTEHFDTLALTGLLPEKKVTVGESWKAANAVAQSLCHLDGLNSQELTCKLETVQGDTAQVSFAGAVQGIEHGAAVKLQVKGGYRFDLKANRITSLEWKQSETRDQGPINPAATVDWTTTLERKSIVSADEVGNFALVPIPATPLPPETMTSLTYTDPKARYEFTCPRDWHLVGRTDDHLVLRLLDKGEFIAQVNLSLWKKAQPGKHLSGDEFKAVISETPGWEQEEVLEAKEVPAPERAWAYHVAATGALDGLKAIQHFYLVAGPEGDQLVLAFTMTPAQAQKLSTRDVILVRSIAFPGPRLEEGKKENR